MKVEYDIEKEMNKLQKKSDKILIKYSNIVGVEYILNKTITQYDSKYFHTLTKSLVKYIDKYNEKYPQDEVDILSLRDEFPLLKYSLGLKDSKIKKFYIPSLWDNTIVYGHFEAISSFIVGILTMKSGEASINNCLELTDRVMFLLEDFDNKLAVNSVDENFFKHLSVIKWNKKASKFFEKILSLQFNVVDLIITDVFSDIRIKIFNNYRFSLTMLTACSTVNRGSNRMEYEDVICAFKTFYKLLDANLDDLV